MARSAPDGPRVAAHAGTTKRLDPGGRSPTFALVIPTHRRPALVVAAVDSALRQSRPFDQVIVIADGQDDPAPAQLIGLPVETWAIARGGVAASRNAGVARARTDWVCFLDDDDLLHPDYLARVEQEVVAAPEIAAMNTEYWSFAAEAGPEDEFAAETLDECLVAARTAIPRKDLTYLRIEGRSFDLLLERLRGSMSTSAVRRDILTRAGAFPDGMATAEDWTMYVNVARLTEWRVITERLAFFRDHPNTATRAGSASNGLTTLRAIRAFWRPSPLPTPPHRPLDAYRPHYRQVLSWCLRACWRARDWESYAAALRVAREILPRRSDRIRAAAPHWMRAAARRARMGG